MKRAVDPALIPFIDALAEMLVADHTRDKARPADQEKHPGRVLPFPQRKGPYRRLKRPRKAISRSPR
jgi:hypothetical protein